MERAAFLVESINLMTMKSIGATPLKMKFIKKAETYAEPIVLKINPIRYVKGIIAKPYKKMRRTTHPKFDPIIYAFMS